MAGKEKKGRKYDRNRKRPSNAAYTVAKRWVTNKAKAIKRNARKCAQAAIRRIQWEICKGKTTLQAEAARLQELRNTVSQNRTG